MSAAVLVAVFVTISPVVKCSVIQLLLLAKDRFSAIMSIT